MIGDDSLQRRMFQAADDRWQAELVAVFGAQAGDARYDARGRSTPRLAELARVRDADMRRWHEATDARRRILG